MSKELENTARPPARPEPEIRRERVEEDGEVWRVYAAIDSHGRVLAAVRIPERLLDRGNNAMAGAFCGWLLRDLGKRL